MSLLMNSPNLLTKVCIIVLIIATELCTTKLSTLTSELDKLLANKLKIVSEYEQNLENNETREKSLKASVKI